MRSKQQLVRLWKRPSKDGRSFTYYLRYYNMENKEQVQSLRHADARKAEKQRLAKEKELRMGYCPSGTMRLREFVTDSLERTGSNIRPSTREEYQSAMDDFIKVVGNIDYQRISLEEGEFYRQACLDRGNSPATVKKKLIEIKRFFELAVKRKQLEDNPLKYIDMPKPKKKRVRIYSEAECRRMLKGARDFISDRNDKTNLKWDLLILIALQTGMRRGELLNLCWSDIDFDEYVIDITGKDVTGETWEWLIKDHEERTVPISENTTKQLIALQEKCPPGYPYVFIPQARYEFIQSNRRGKGDWTYSDSRLGVVNNFYKHWGGIFKRAQIKKKGKFHDLRSTALSNWFAQGLSEYEIMKLAGHSSFETTHKFYLAIKNDYIDKARQANVGLDLRLEVGK
jgi:integrase